MSRSRIIVVALVALGLLIAGGLAWTNYTAQPSLITGDAWDYRLHPTDVGESWSLSDQVVMDVAQLSATDVATSTLNVPGLMELYTESFSAAADRPEITELGVRVLRFATIDDADTALNAETLGEGWAKIGGTVPAADVAQVWGYTDPDPTLQQGVYRVDFRVLNVIGSVSILGSADGVPDPAQAIAYAGKMVERMRSQATPPELKSTGFFQAAPPDLRPLLLNPAQLAEIDTQFGDRWLINTNQLPSFTSNNEFSAAALPVLEKAGRLLGYQSYWVKGITQVEEAQTTGVLLFQQVSVYNSTAGATTGLNAMAGLSANSEITPGPAIGDAGRKWVIVTQPGVNPNGQSAVVEINFRVGRYVASIQITSRPVANESAAIAVSGPTDALAEALAHKLAENLGQAP